MATFEVLKKEVLPTIPNSPGIYKYYNGKDEILYVGKAKNLRKRVASYFTQKHSSGKTYILVQKIARIEFTVVETEQDALLLESVLIKKLQPKYNILLKDDKSYPYICIKNERFPRLFLTREVVKDGSEYLGPYTSTRQVRTILDFLKTLFQLRTCTFLLSEKNINKGKFKVCLEYHIGNCKGPCANLQTEAEYLDTIQQVRKILKGNISSVIKYLKEKMQEAANAFDFEQAHQVKEKLLSLENYQSRSTIVNPKINNLDVYSIDENDKRAYISYLKVVNGTIIRTKVLEMVKNLDETTEDLLVFGINELQHQFDQKAKEIVLPILIDFPDKNLKITVPQIGDKKKLLDLAKKNAFYYKKQYELKHEQRKTGQERTFEILQQLKNDLRLKDLPTHIECFDNSNIQGAYPVASMVCFKEAKPAKKEYRHFNIKTVVGPDDFASMTEVVYRRYKRLKDEEKSLPQLVLIDGGKGQLSAAVKSLKELDLYHKIAIVGIAKKLEEIYVPKDPYPLHIDKRSSSLKLLQQLRNEAHRFAITHHRNLRSKGAINSELENIKGIGEKTTAKLLAHFKSIKVIQQASEAELSKIITLQQAKNIKAYFDK